MSARVHKLVISNFIVESGYYKIPKSDAGKPFLPGKAFVESAKFVVSKDKSQKTEILQHHSTKDQKLSKNDLKTITWKFHIFQTYAFASCIKWGYRKRNISVTTGEIY